MQDMKEIRVRSLDGEDPIEKGMATHSSVLAWRIPGTVSLVGCRLWGHTVLSVCMSLCLSVCLCVCLLMLLSLSVFVSLTVCVSECVSQCMCFSVYCVFTLSQWVSFSCVFLSQCLCVFFCLSQCSCLPLSVCVPCSECVTVCVKYFSHFPKSLWSHLEFSLYPLK